MSRIRDVYRAVAGGICLFAVVMQYFQVVHGDTAAALLSASIHFFSFFTILSNVLAAAALLIPLIWPNSTAGRFLARPSVRTAIAGYIIMVGVVYFLLLHDLSRATGARLVFERALHYLTPPLFVLDWLAFVPKADLPLTVGMGALGFPTAYAVWTLLHGAVSGWYPYPFLDVGDLGYPRTLLNIAGLVFAYLVLELALVGCGRLMQHRGRTELP